MTYDKFIDCTDRSFAELLRITERYADVSLDGKAVGIRTAMMLKDGEYSEEQLTLSTFQERVWSEESLPWLLFIAATEVTETTVVVRVQISGRRSFTNPEWETRTAYANTTRKPYYPYYLDSPIPPKEWALTQTGDNFYRADGKPSRYPLDWERSLAINGRFALRPHIATAVWQSPK